MNRNNNGYVLHARHSGNNVGGVYVHTSATSFQTSSDYRLKENVVSLDGAITRVKQLTPKRFNFIVEPDTTVDGFIAHEAATVVPELSLEHITKSMMMVILFIKVLIMANLFHY